MSRFRLTIAHLSWTVVLAAIVLAAFRVSPNLGFTAAFVVLGASYRERILRVLDRPVGRSGLAVVILVIATAPAVLFFDPATYRPMRRGHIVREPLSLYKLFSDDVAYVASSRTWDRTVSNLFVPHNTHIVPAWRLVTWALVASAGSLERTPTALAFASYAILVAVMLMAGRLVARETGRTGLGLAAMALMGTTSLMVAPAVWYSAGQPLWAGFGILAALWYAQSYRRSGRAPALVLAGISAAVAGGFWTIGHMAGPVAAVYLWVDGRRRCRRAAIVPLAATLLAVGMSMALAPRAIDSRVSFHGRTVRQAIDPVQGVFHTAQAIPENLVLGSLGLVAHSTPIQGLFLTLGLAIVWVGSRWRRGAEPSPPAPVPAGSGQPRWGLPRVGVPFWSSFAFNPLECAGAALVLGSYLVEWTFRGYMDFVYLRTINLYALVPWYDAIPQIGAVLFAVGWWSGPRCAGDLPASKSRSTSLTWRDVLGPAVLTIVLIVLNRPRVETLVRDSTPSLLPSEQKVLKIARLQTMRSNMVLLNRAEWQRVYLRRLDAGEKVARRMGLGQDEIRAAFGFLWIPGAIGRFPPTADRELYDVAGLLDLPPRGSSTNPAVVRSALGPYLDPVKEPRPGWIPPSEPWPPEGP
jgi:predicted outer membrane lipoprotein